jgi:hypothetical protein
MSSNFLNVYQKYKGGTNKGGANKGTKRKKGEDPILKLTFEISNIGTSDLNTIINNTENIMNIIKEINLSLNKRFDEECFKYIINLNNVINSNYKINELTELECYERYVNMYKDPKLDNIHAKLEKLYSTRRNEYDQIKCHVDGYDIIHDITSQAGYVMKLREIYNELSTPDSGNPFMDVNSNNHKLNESRETHVKELKKKMGDIFLIKDEKILTEMEGYAIFFQEIYKICGSSAKSFKYTESGRLLNHVNMKNYYKEIKTDDDKEKEFKKICLYNEENELKELYEQLFDTDTDTTINYEIKKDAISSFDACLQTMDGKNKTEPQIIKNVYGYYDYYIASNMIEIPISRTSKTLKIPFHMVIVTYNLKPPMKYLNKNSIIACFLFQGSIDIDFLVIECNKIFGTNINVPRGKDENEDSIKKVTNSYFIENKKIKSSHGDIDLLPEFLPNGFDELVKYVLSTTEESTTEADEFIKIINNTDSGFYTNGYYFKADLVSNEKQLILFGNKTVGDLIFSCENYKTQIYSLTTTDSFIRASVLYNYLCGNSPILQSVWRNMKGDKWIYSEGIFSTSPEDQTKQLLIQFASVLGFIQHYENNNGYEETKDSFNIHNVLKVLSNNILINLFLSPDDSSQLPDDSSQLTDDSSQLTDDSLQLTDDSSQLTNDSSQLTNDSSRFIDELLKRLSENVVNFDTIQKFLTIINQLNSVDITNNIKSIIDMVITNLEDVHIKLFYSLLYHEVQYKNKLINKYLQALSEIDEINLIKSINKLSNIFYINAVSCYENDKSTITKFIESITIPERKSSRRVSTTSRQSSTIVKHFTILNVDPNLDKVIIKGDVTSISTETGISNPEQKTIKDKMIDIKIINDRGKIIPLTFKNEPYTEINNIGKQVKKEIQTDNAYNSKAKRIIKPIPNINAKEGTFDNDIYYKLVNNTLKYPTLEIILFSFNEIIEDTSVLKLGVYELGDGKKLFISLWEVKNTIGNLFKLLTLNSIKNDYLSIYLILTRILTNYKYILMKCTDNIEKTCDIYASKIVVENNNEINVIINNLLQIKKNEIQVYEDTKKFIEDIKDGMEVQDDEDTINEGDEDIKDGMEVRDDEDTKKDDEDTIKEGDEVQGVENTTKDGMEVQGDEDTKKDNKNTIKDKLYKTNDEIYNLFNMMILSSDSSKKDQIKTTLNNKLVDNINECTQIINDLEQYMTNLTQRADVELSNGEPPDDYNQSGGDLQSKIKKYIIKFYLYRNAQNKIIFDDLNEYDEYLIADDNPNENRISYIPEIMEQQSYEEGVAISDKYYPTSEEIEIMKLRNQLIRVIINTQKRYIYDRINKKIPFSYDEYMKLYNILKDDDILAMDKYEINLYINKQKDLINFLFYDKTIRNYIETTILVNKKVKQILAKVKQILAKMNDITKSPVPTKSIVPGPLGGKKNTKKIFNKRVKNKKTKRNVYEH